MTDARTHTHTHKHPQEVDDVDKSKSANQKVILLVKVSKALFWDTDYVALDQFQKL